MKRFLFLLLFLAALAVQGAAPGNLRTYANLNVVLASNPTLLGPHVVTEGYWPGLLKGGLELVWDPVDASDTNTFDCFKSQSTDWTSPDGRWRAVRNGNNYDVTTAGARGDWPTTADDATAITSMIGVLAQNGIPANVIMPVGIYGDPGGILVGKNNGVSYSTVNGIHIIGDVRTASGEPGQVKIVVTDGSAAGILMQNCADCSVENINFVGLNSFFGEAKVDENNFAGTFLNIENFKSSVNTVSTNRYAPHVGIAIDPFSSTTPTQYPGLAENYVGTGGASSSIKLLNCTFTDFVAPWVVTPATDGGGVHHFLAENCKTIQNTYGAGFGTSLVDFRIKNHQWRDVYTIFSTDDFGNQTGTIPNAEGHAKYATYIFEKALTNITTSIDIEYQNIQAKVVGGAGPEANGRLMIVASGYTGAGTKFASDDGSYKTVITSPAGNTTEVQFNDAGAFGADSDFAWNKTLNQLSLRKDAVNSSAVNLKLINNAQDGVSAQGAAINFIGASTTTANLVLGALRIDQSQAWTGTASTRDSLLRADLTLDGNSVQVLNISPSGNLNLGTVFDVGWYKGNGNPNGSVVAVVGSFYTRLDGGAGTTVYFKETGTGNTGWVAYTSGGGSSDNWVASGTTNSLLYGKAFLNSALVTNNLTVGFPFGSPGIYLDGVGASLTFGGSSPNGRVDLNNGSLSFGATSQILTFDNNDIDPKTAHGVSYFLLSSDSGTASARTFKLDSGESYGHILFIHWTAGAGELIDDSLFNDTGGHVRLKGDWTPAVDDVLALIYDGTDWVEISRSSGVGGGGTSDNWVASGTTNSVLYGTASVDSLTVTNLTILKNGIFFTDSSYNYWGDPDGYTTFVSLHFPDQGDSPDNEWTSGVVGSAGGNYSSIDGATHGSNTNNILSSLKLSSFQGTGGYFSQWYWKAGLAGDSFLSFGSAIDTPNTLFKIAPAIADDGTSVPYIINTPARSNTGAPYLAITNGTTKLLDLSVGGTLTPNALVIGSTNLATALAAKQPLDSDLTTWAGVTPGTGVATALAVNVGSAGAPVINGGALGTPSSGTLTSATGLPISGLTASTSTAIGVGSVEIGHATDTTVARVSAGVISVEGVNVLTTATGQALDSDLTTIAGLTATTDSFMQSKSSAWASRTVSQVETDLQGTGLLTDSVGFRIIPQNSQSAAYTTVAADSGKHIFHPAADTTARTWTIDSNANVAYPVGTAITFVNETLGGVVTIAITSDTLLHAADATTGNYTLAASKIATALKITSTKWIISP